MTLYITLNNRAISGKKGQARYQDHIEAWTLRIDPMQHRTHQHDLDTEWANSPGLPLLLVIAMVVLTAVILPDDLPFSYSDANPQLNSDPREKVSIIEPGPPEDNRQPDMGG